MQNLSATLMELSQRYKLLVTTDKEKDEVTYDFEFGKRIFRVRKGFLETRNNHLWEVAVIDEVSRKAGKCLGLFETQDKACEFAENYVEALMRSEVLKELIK